MDSEGATGLGRGQGSGSRRGGRGSSRRTRPSSGPRPRVAWQDGPQSEATEHVVSGQSRRSRRVASERRPDATPSSRHGTLQTESVARSGRAVSTVQSNVTLVDKNASDNVNGSTAHEHQQQGALNVQASEFYPLEPSLPGSSSQTRGKSRRPNRRSGKREKSGKEDTGVGDSLRLEKQQHSADDVVGRGTESPAGLENMPPNCLLCCNPADIVAFGRCNHPIACAKCCLRLRMCYKRTDCPLCKTDTQDIAVAYWRPNLPLFEHLTDSKTLNVVRTRPGQLGPGVIAVDTWRQQGPASTRLFHDLKRMTSISCALCIPQSSRKQFSNLKSLENHVKAEHGRYMCVVCLREGREFPLDAQMYESMAAVRQHAAASHPRCSFCRGKSFYDGDLLWSHMMENHFKCQVCQSSGVQNEAWFANVEDLRTHLAASHFACDDPECVVCLVAFTTAEELRRHTVQRHSSRMTRWNASSARRLDVDIQFSRRERARERTRGFAQESDGGMTVIDDDLGMLWDTERPEDGSERESQQHEAFPALAAAILGSTQAPIPSTSASASASAFASEGERIRRPPPLVKHTVRCPCGRRVTYPVVEEGQTPPPVQCDAVCQLESRRHALADAFGISDPDRHISVFDRKPVVWSGALLQVAKQDMGWVEGIERELKDFIADPRTKRRALGPMNRQKRMAVHGIAQQYGIASASVGQEPKRAVELFKTDQAAMLPAQLLSRVAASVSDAQVQAMLQAALKFPILFDEIIPTVDIHYYLRRWEGQYEVEWKAGSTAIVRFEQESDRNEVLDTFGGGIRGLFRIDRSWKEETGICVTQSSSSLSTVAPWANGGGTAAEGGSSSAAGGVYTTALLSNHGSRDSRSRGPADINTNPNAEDGGNQGKNGMSVPTGWAVIGGKKNPRGPRDRRHTTTFASGAGHGLMDGNPNEPASESRFSLLGIADHEVSET